MATEEKAYCGLCIYSGTEIKDGVEQLLCSWGFKMDLVSVFPGSELKEYRRHCKLFDEEDCC